MLKVFKISDSQNETTTSASYSFIIRISKENFLHSCKVCIVLQESPKIYFPIDFKLVNDSFCQREFLHARVKNLKNKSNKQFVVMIYMMKFEDTNTLTTISTSIETEYFVCFNSSSFEAKVFTKPLSQSLLFENNLYMYCKVVMENDLPVKSSVSAKKQPANFLALYEHKVLTDINVICKDKEFSTHKAILAYQSSVFRAMFENQMKESRENKLEIIDFEPEIVELMINFIYSSEIKTDLPVQTLEQLYMIANKYDLQSLTNHCVQEICKSLKSMSEVMDVMLFAGAYNFTEFKEVMLKFIQDNGQKLL